MRFKDGKEPDHTASYLSDKADQRARDDLGQDGKKLTAKERAKLSKDKNFTQKRLRADEN